MAKIDLALVRNNNVKKESTFIRQVIAQKELVLITLPFLLLLIMFNYVPLWGWIMSFMNYKPALGMGSQWVGFKNFIDLFNDKLFYIALRNTLGISGLKFVAGFFTSITLAVLVNEVRSTRFKRTVQTISYLPHFVSWVVAANIVYNVLSPDGGIVNDIFMRLHFISEPINFMGNPKMFWGIMTGSDVWKEVGWNSIIYISAMTAIDSEMYEAADIDGAGRIRKIFSITLPSIVPTIKILLILNAGWLLNVGFEQTYLLSNPTVVDVSQTLELYVYNFGLPLGRYSFATAAGIFNSIVALVLVTTFNKISKMLDGESAF